MSTTPATPPCVITLQHNGAEDHVITFDDQLLAADEWLERVLFLPSMPQRVIGFVHPAADTLVGTRPFLLHAAFAFYSMVAMRPVPPHGMEVSKGPQMIVPYDMLSPIDLWIGECASWVWVHRQPPAWRDAMKIILLRNLLPEGVSGKARSRRSRAART